jgi:outer membrane protein assembly factor BamB
MTPLVPFRNPRPLWRANLGRPIETPPVIDPGGRVFVAAGTRLRVLEPNGRTAWRLDASGADGAIRGGLALDDRQVYAATARGVLLALGRDEGRVRWRTPLAAPPAPANGSGTTPHLFLVPPMPGGDGRVFVAGMDDQVYAVVAHDGVRRWRFRLPDGTLGYAAPTYAPATAPSDDDALFVCGDSVLYRLDPATGRERWRARLGGGNAASTPAVSLNGRRVFVGTNGAGIHAFDARTGARQWTFAGDDGPTTLANVGDWFGAPLPAANDTVYVGTYRGRVYALDAATGQVLWTATRVLPGPALAAPAFDPARNVVYVAAETPADTPSLWALDAASGRALFSFRAGSLAVAPLISGDRLYSAALDGNLRAFAL